MRKEWIKGQQHLQKAASSAQFIRIKRFLMVHNPFYDRPLLLDRVDGDGVHEMSSILTMGPHNLITNDSFLQRFLHCLKHETEQRVEHKAKRTRSMVGQVTLRKNVAKGGGNLHLSAGGPLCSYSKFSNIWSIFSNMGEGPLCSVDSPQCREAFSPCHSRRNVPLGAAKREPRHCSRLLNLSCGNLPSLFAIIKCSPVKRKR
jgi:hypothetical protein